MITVYALSALRWTASAVVSHHLGGYCVLAGPGCSAQGAQLHRLLHLQLDLFPARTAYRLPSTRSQSARVLNARPLTGIDPGLCVRLPAVRRERPACWRPVDCRIVARERRRVSDVEATGLADRLTAG